MAQPKEPPLPTLADVYGTDAKRVIGTNGKELCLAGIEFADGGRLWRIPVASVVTPWGHVAFSSTDWAESTSCKLRYIFPVTYEPPPLEAQEWERGLIKAARPWWKKILRVK